MLYSRSRRREVCAVVVISIVICMIALPAAAANHYVRPSPGRYGTGTGLDWNNACADFAGSCAVGSLVRGDTYYVAAGNYAAQTWNTATSGTAQISIVRATAETSSGVVGWNSAFDGRVVWGYGHTVGTGYWTFDGVTAKTMNDGTTYGFYFNHDSNCSSNQTIVSIQATDATFKNVAMDMCPAQYDYAKWCFEITPGANNTLISHAYCNSSIDFIQTNGDQAQSNGVYEYVYTSNNGGTGNNHGEVYQLVCNGCTIRYNWFQDCSSTSCISGNAGTAPGAPNMIPLYNTHIYGNVFNNVNAGNGVIHAAGSTGIAGTRFYNNTIVNQTLGPFFDECGGHACPSGSGNNIVENNLIWNGICSLGDFGLSGDVDDYNTFLSCTSSAPSEAHGQVGSINPFVAAANLNFQLTTESSISAGLVLASPYNLDPNGVTRGADGTWERGAFEFNTRSASGPAPPTHLIVSII